MIIFTNWIYLLLLNKKHYLIFYILILLFCEPLSYATCLNFYAFTLNSITSEACSLSHIFLYKLGKNFYSITTFIYFVPLVFKKINLKLWILIFLTSHQLTDANLLFYTFTNFSENLTLNHNFSLSNSLFYVHPLLIYYLIFKVCQLMNSIKLPNNYNYKLLNNLIYISLLALMLGAVWSSQELNWGGYWNWDMVELENLFYFSAILGFCHNSSKIKIKQVVFLISLISLTFLLNRIGFNTSIHSFVLNSDVYFYFYFLIFTGIVNFYKQYLSFVVKFKIIFINLWINFIVLVLFINSNFFTYTNFNLIIFLDITKLVVIATMLWFFILFFKKQTLNSCAHKLLLLFSLIFLTMSYLHTQLLGHNNQLIFYKNITNYYPIYTQTQGFLLRTLSNSDFFFFKELIEAKNFSCYSNFNKIIYKNKLLFDYEELNLYLKNSFFTDLFLGYNYKYYFFNFDFFYLTMIILFFFILYTS